MRCTATAVAQNRLNGKMLVESSEFRREKIFIPGTAVPYVVLSVTDKRPIADAGRLPTRGTFDVPGLV